MYYMFNDDAIEDYSPAKQKQTTTLSATAI